MAFFNRWAGFTHAFRQGPYRRIKPALCYFWDAYSKPAPETIREGLTLLCLCSIVAMVTGGFLFHWMSQCLRYDQLASATVAGFYAVAAFLLLSLVHPLRCTLALILPSLGTKQGRKLIISTSMMLLALNVIPNIASNVGVVAHVLKCTASGLAQSLINSSELVNTAKGDLVKEARKVDFLVPRLLTEFDHDTNINVSQVKQRFVVVSQQIENDISHIKRVVEDIRLVANRLLAAFFVIYLFVESALYLNTYLTNVKFDNIYITGQLEHMARENGILSSDMKNMVSSTSYKISKQEFLKCVLRLAGVSLYFVVVVFIVVMDHAVCHLVKAGQPLLLDQPPSSISITINYKVQLFIPSTCIVFCSRKNKVNFTKDYGWNFGFMSERCTLEPSEPDAGVTVALGLLYLLAYSMVLLEVYVRRARRKVSASFFPTQERKRTEFIFKKILTRQEKQKGGS
ncbi:osteoclast stimulatory transmembrane protein [Anguilla anguilla]|uniref:osteoclast stimulatory transmembrane protein n=1 Tax=Anguilla anguilla TaxID=7936 RepID=UPI0015AA10E0|nr:osteoclast stimulatory transmembrane protein [Anguilla anguilla]